MLKRQQSKVRPKKKTKIMPKQVKGKGKRTGKMQITIKNRMIISYLLCVAIPLIIVNLISSSNSRNTLKDTSSQLATQMTEQTCASISSFGSEMEKLANRIIINDLNATSYNLLNEYMSVGKGKDVNKNNDKIAKYSIERDIKSQLLYSLALDDRFSAIALTFTEDNKVMSTYSNKAITEEEILKLGEYGQQSKIKWITDFPGHEGQIFIARQLSNIKSGVNAGSFIAEISIKSLVEQIQSIQLFDGAQVFLLDENGQVLGASEGAEASDEVLSVINSENGSGSEETKDALITYSTSTNGWKVVAKIPTHTLTDSIDTVNNMMWILIVISAIIAVLFGIMISSSIIKFIGQIRMAMKKAEDGDLNSQVHIVGNDELSELGESFNNMVAKIKELIQETQNTIENVLESSNVLKRNTERSIETFNQLTLSIGEIAEGSSSQAEDTQNGAAMMENLAESIKTVISNTENVYQQSRGTKEKIEAASDRMNRLNKAMDDSAAISADISKSIISLNDLTKTISEVMQLLDGISGQTNLLALNASIEAARAGDVGRGFAVVANEVRNLSEQSKESTNSVRETLKHIEIEAGNAVELVKKGNIVFEEQEKVGHETKESLEEMISDLVSINEGINEVNVRSNSMSTLKDNVGEKIESITTVTEENAAAAEELNALGEEQKAVMEELSHLSDKLNDQLEGLRNAVSQFKI